MAPNAHSVTAVRAIARLAAIAAVIGAAAQARAYCSTEAPPKGLVERCRSKEFLVSDAMNDEQLRAALDITLLEWMEGCVIKERAAGLIGEAEESIDHMFSLLKDRRGTTRTFRIMPDYVPLTYREGGKTCFGVKSVSFRLAGSQSDVDEPDDDDIQVTPGAPSDVVKQAAAESRKALEDPSVPGSAELSRFLSVLIALEKDGTDLDDTWYDLGPFSIGDPMNSGACYKEFKTGSGQVCRSVAEARKACERHLGQDLVAGHGADRLQELAGKIQRGIDHIAVIKDQDSPGAVPCPSISEFFMPKINELAGKHSLYGAGQY